MMALLSQLARAGAFVRALSGWRRFGFAFAAGAVSALGFAPFNLFPALLIGFAALVLLIDNACAGAKPVKTAASLGWAFGFGQFLVGLHWIGYAFMVDAEAHAWQIPFVAVLFPGGLALFQTATAVAAAKLWRSGPARLFLFTALYGLAEWLRGHILTGFPWNLPAYGWGASLAVLQITALIGAYGLSLLTILFGAVLAELFAEKPQWKLPAIMAGLFVAIWLGGAVRLALVPVHNMPGVTLRLVQPNIPQAEKYQRRYVVRNWRRLVELSRAPGNASVIVWPEAAPPFLLEEQPLALAAIGSLTAKADGLITGGLRREYLPGEEVRYSNSLFVFGRKGVPLGVYDKSHLVPFGEYLPFEKTLNALGLEKLTGIDGSFTPGEGRKTFTLPGAGVLTPLICYEILFPGEVVGDRRPDWIVNITDDSWFGPWAGPRQHLLVARVRAIEEGIPVARAANTGISAIIDPFGRVVKSLKLGEMGTLDGPLPAAIAPTPFSRFEGWWFWFILCVIVALTWRVPRGI
jgi:apolipoprotein N-acyltransferase